MNKLNKAKKRIKVKLYKESWRGVMVSGNLFKEMTDGRYYSVNSLSYLKR